MNEIIQMAQKGNIEAIRLLVDEKNITQEELDAAIYQAGINKHKALFELLIANNADAETAMYVSAENGWIDIVKILLSRGVSANPESGLPLTRATKNNHMQIVELLLENGANPNAGNAIIFAAQTGNLKLVELLVQKGANVNPPSNSPLSVAIINKHVKVAEFLQEKGAKLLEEYQVTETVE